MACDRRRCACNCNGDGCVRRAGCRRGGALHTARGCPLCRRHAVPHRSSRRRTRLARVPPATSSDAVREVASRLGSRQSLESVARLLVLLPRHAAAVGATATVSSSRGLHRSLPGSCVHGGPRLCACHDGRSPVGQHHDGAQRCGRLLPCVLVDAVCRLRRSRSRWYGQVTISNACDPVTSTESSDGGRRWCCRKVCGGNRSEHGAETHAVLASVLRTIQQRQLDAGHVFSTLLRSPEPITALAPHDHVISTTS